MILAKRSVLNIVLIIAIYLFSWVLQTHLFLNWDVSQLLQVTRFMLDGGRYGIDYLTPNPPMILYISVIPIWVSQLFSISIVVAFQWYVFFLAAVSLSLCYVAMKKIIKTEDVAMLSVFVMALAVIWLILPTYNLGQRDHLLVIFSMPYFLLVAARLQDRQLSPSYAAVVGIFASLGFALKPHFLIAWLLVEVYYFCRKKTGVSLIRPEVVALLMVMILYSLTTWLFFPEYFQLIIPFISKYYISSLSVPLIDLILNHYLLFSLLVLLVCVFTLKNEEYSELTSVLCVALSAFILICILQRSSLIYHVIPQLSLASLLLLVWFCVLFKKYKSHCFTLVTLVLITLTIYMVYSMYVFGIYYKKNYLTPMVDFVNKLPVQHKNLYVFGQAGWYGVPLVDYTGMTYAQTIDCFWLATDLVKRTHRYADRVNRAYIKNNSDPMFFINIVARDFNKYKPDLVFVEVSNINFLVNGEPTHFNYLDYFLENNAFKKSWNHYVYFDTLKTKFYDTTIQVYKRIPDHM